MLEQSVTSRSTTVLPVTYTVGAVTMLLREIELLAATLEVTGLGAPWLLVWVPMCPWSWVGVLQWTPHKWQTSMPPEAVPPKPPGLSFHSWPWCFWAWTRRYVSVVKPDGGHESREFFQREIYVSSQSGKSDVVWPSICKVVLNIQRS